ncbi:DUF1828 domain-containing protein [Amycolatopsis minnesotensis]|uniref:DUF1829 domain-containing protein n=1 Tax=Amycolatopsis minnesotensis TaxID=337894 RepID=A0ABP5DIA8_9PSEU
MSRNLLADSYISWLKNEVSEEVIDSKVSELTTPFLDRHNDYIQVYAEQQENNSYLLTDDGYITSELRSSGVDGKGSRREELFSEILSGHGVVLEGSELQTKATSDDLGQRLHSLIQAMLSVDDMFVLSQPSIHGLFMDDVANFLEEKNVRYIARAKFSGKSGLDHLADFVIPKSKGAPERIVQVINTPRRDRVQNMLFSVSDTREARANIQFFALINDRKSKITPEIAQAFENYSVKARAWSKREELVDELAA